MRRIEAYHREEERSPGALYLTLEDVCWKFGRMVRDNKLTRRGVDAAVAYPENCVRRGPWRVRYFEGGGDGGGGGDGCAAWTFDRADWTLRFSAIPPKWPGLYNEQCGRVPPPPDVVHRWVFEWLPDDQTPWDATVGGAWAWAHPAAHLALTHQCPTWGGACDHAHGAWVNTPPGCRHAHASLLRRLARQLDRRNATWFLSDGTLLGAVRGGALIPFDYDADIFVLGAHVERFAAAVRDLKDDPRFADVITRRGWDDTAPNPSVQRWGAVVEWWLYSVDAQGRLGEARAGHGGAPASFKIDGFNFGTNMKASRETAYRDRKTPFALTRIEMEGLPMPVPTETERMLGNIYGRHWRTVKPCVKNIM